MRDFIYSLMTDKRNGLVYMPLKLILYFASLIYGLAVFTRSVFYRFGIFKTNKVPMKVISVGNLTLGGTGKTPFAIMLARMMKDELKRDPSVLTRGYGWDEQTLLKKNLDDVPVMVGEDRTRSSRKAIRLYGSDTAILDDGFQYWEMARDIDIVLIDSRNPFGNGCLFPRGVLREPKDALKRADVIVFTKVNEGIYNIDRMKEDVRMMNGQAVFLEAVHKPRHLYDVKMRTNHDLGYPRGKRALLVSSIGDPEYFEETVSSLGAEVVGHIKFSDHYDYRQKDIDDVQTKCSRMKPDFLITTEKDAVKLTRLGLAISDYSLLVLAVEMAILSGREELVARLHSLYSD